MKYNINKAIAAFLLAISTFAVSCQKDDSKNEYLQLETGSYTFDNKGNSRYGIAVYSNAEWEAKPDADWIRIIERVDDSLFVTVTENENNDMRSGKITFTAGTASADFIVEQLGKSFRGKFIDFANITGRMAFSRNGKYAAGMRRIGLESSRYNPIIFNLETGEEKVLDEVNKYGMFQFVSNDATVMCMGLSEAATTDLYINGELTVLSLPDGYRAPRYQDMSADCNIIVGYCLDNQGKYAPVKWVNGEPIILEYPEKDLWGEKNPSGAMARGCSDDGSIIYGSDWSHGSNGTIVWTEEGMTYIGAAPGYNEVYDDGEHAVCTGIIKYAEFNSISKNGRYLAASYKDENLVCHPCLIDLETMEITDYRDIDGLGYTANNNGVLFTGSPSYGGCTEAYISNDNGSALIPASDWFKEKYGIAISNDRFVEIAGDGFFAGYRGMRSYLTGGINTRYFFIRPE